MESQSFVESEMPSYQLHEGHWTDEEFQESMDLVLGEEFLFGKTDLLKITSAGVHIGAATTHLTVSKLGLRKAGRSISSKSVVKTKEVFYDSPIIPTPYVEDGSLDIEGLRLFLEASWNEARLIADLIDSGVVVLSGRAREKKNALALQRLFGAQRNRYLFLSQNPSLQGVIAALGSGGFAKSGTEGKRVLCVDLGAESSRLVWIASGSVENICGLRGGSRSLGFDSQGNLNHLDASGQIIASELGLNLRLGKPVTRSERQTVGRFLGDTLVDLLEEEEPSELAKRFLTGSPLRSAPVDLLQFSGGVAEYVYGYEKESRGDVGLEWGDAIRKRAPRLGLKMMVHTPSARIRAIPIGLAYHSVNLPAESVYSSHGHLHGLKNAMVLCLRLPSDPFAPSAVQAEVERALNRFDPEDSSGPIAFSVDSVENEGLYDVVASGLFSALHDRIDHDNPLVLIGETGAARSIARKIASNSSGHIDAVALCGLHAHDLDFLEVGEAEHGEDIPVVTRSLVFR